LFCLLDYCANRAGKKAAKSDANDSSDDDSSDDDDDDNMEISVHHHHIEKEMVWFPFAVPAIIMDLRSRSLNNSLRMFLKLQAKSLVGDRTNMRNLVTLRTFKEFYHSFCFDQRMVPKTFERGRLKEMQRFGLTIKTLYDHRTDAFVRIRLCNPKEKRERQEINPFPRETALSFFVRTQCIISPFDVDYCTFRDFSHAYERFNNQSAKVKRCRPVPVTKREMMKLGIQR
jgi:hypothetical protein